VREAARQIRFERIKPCGKFNCKGEFIKMFKQFFYEKIFFLVFAAALVSACGASGDFGQRKNVATGNKNAALAAVTDKNKPKILAFGDSLTIGFGLTEKESYPSLLQEKLNRDGYNYEVINAGVSGDTSGGGLERIDWALNQPNIEIMILELGANDILRGLSVEQMKTNLREIIRRAKAKNIKVLLCGMYAPMNFGGERGQTINAAFASLAKEEKVTFLPFFLERVGGVPNLNQADGIHPNAEGTQIVAETVYNAVKPLLKKT
jgi:acyl-CoA thioesterase-1